MARSVTQTRAESPQSRFSSDSQARDSATALDSVTGKRVLDARRQTRVDHLIGVTNMHNGRASVSGLSVGIAGGKARRQSRIEAIAIAEGYRGTKNWYRKLFGCAKRDPDVPWVDSPIANILFGNAICVNILVMGLETDLNDEYFPEPHSLPWYMVECMFQCIFIYELLLHYCVEGRRAFWAKPHNIFDLGVITLSLLDLCVLTPLLSTTSGLNFISALKILRLARLLRVLRLFRKFAGLWAVIVAMGTALASLGWMIVLTGLACYTGAVIVRIVLGPSVESIDSSNPNADSLKQQWSTVPQGMFTLFVMMTGEGWYDITRDAMELEETMLVFFVPFLCLTHLLMMNCIVGVVTQSVIRASHERELRARQMADQETMWALAEVFVLIDENNSDLISCEELADALNNSEIRDMFSALGIEIEELGYHDLEDAPLFVKFWDKDSSGDINFHEFVNGAMKLKHSEETSRLLILSQKILQVLTRILGSEDGSAGKLSSTSTAAYRCVQRKRKSKQQEFKTVFEENEDATDIEPTPPKVVSLDTKVAGVDSVAAPLPALPRAEEPSEVRGQLQDLLEAHRAELVAAIGSLDRSLHKELATLRSELTQPQLSQPRTPRAVSPSPTDRDSRSPSGSLDRSLHMELATLRSELTQLQLSQPRTPRAVSPSPTDRDSRSPSGTHRSEEGRLKHVSKPQIVVVPHSGWKNVVNGQSRAAGKSGNGVRPPSSREHSTAQVSTPSGGDGLKELKLDDFLTTPGRNPARGQAGGRESVATESSEVMHTDKARRPSQKLDRRHKSRLPSDDVD